jgi:hypothetical protein
MTDDNNFWRKTTEEARARRGTPHHLRRQKPIMLAEIRTPDLGARSLLATDQDIPFLSQQPS